MGWFWVYGRPGTGIINEKMELDIELELVQLLGSKIGTTNKKMKLEPGSYMGRVYIEIFVENDLEII